MLTCKQSIMAKVKIAFRKLVFNADSRVNYDIFILYFNFIPPLHLNCYVKVNLCHSMLRVFYFST